MDNLTDILLAQPMTGETENNFSFKYVTDKESSEFPGKKDDRIHSFLDGWGTVEEDENGKLFIQYDSGYRSDWFERLTPEEQQAERDRINQVMSFRPILIPMIKRIIP